MRCNRFGVQSPANEPEHDEYQQGWPADASASAATAAVIGIRGIGYGRWFGRPGWCVDAGGIEVGHQLVVDGGFIDLVAGAVGMHGAQDVLLGGEGLGDSDDPVVVGAVTVVAGCGCDGVGALPGSGTYCFSSYSAQDFYRNSRI